jgi:hypothetical protein
MESQTIGIPAPAPAPKRTWYPIHFGLPVSVWNVEARPAPKVSKIVPKKSGGLKYPVLVTKGRLAIE